jgi:hypothetical protein
MRCFSAHHDPGRRKLIVLAHKPLYIADPQIRKRRKARFFRASRAWQTCSSRREALMLSGHIHAVKTARWGSIRQIWAPSTLRQDAAGRKKKRHGVQRPGYLLHSLNGPAAHL